MATAARKPPSRIRYEENNPVVSLRVSKELKARLDEIRQISGKSLGDILREAADLQEESTGAAYTEGWHDAYEKYAVTYPCSVCGKTIWVQTEGEKKAIAGYMREHGWHHGSCHER